MFCIAFTRCLIVYSLFVTRVVSVTPWNVSASDLVRQLWMSSIIVDNWLYIEGGEYYLTGARSYLDFQNPPTRSIDLSKSWTSSTVVINQIPKPIDISQVKHPGLFYQKSTNLIQTFGGDPYDPTTNYAIIWGLNVGSKANGDGSWSNIHTTTDSLWQSVTWPRQASYAHTPTGGYALGGHTAAPNSTGATDVSMLLEMTVVNTTTGTFEREADVGAFSTTGGVDSADGHYVPAFGGLVVFLGGIAYGADLIGTSLRSMSEINVYDPKSKKWFIQNASGDIPSGRKNFCITGAQGTNGSTYEIFVYGGSGLEFFSAANADSRNVYILTLPAFRWIKTATTTLPRSGSTCHTVKNQMISYGGFDPTALASYAKQEPWNYGIGIFDLTKLTWGFDYNANADPYVQSDLVNKFYASNSLYPVWDDKSLSALFLTSTSTTTGSGASASASMTTTTDPGISATASNSATPPATPSASSKTLVGAIAGGVVGGVAVLAALILLIWFIRARKKKQEQERLARESNNGVAELHDNQTYPELSTERMSEVHGESQTPHYQVDGQKTNALSKQGPYEVYA